MSIVSDIFIFIINKKPILFSKIHNDCKINCLKTISVCILQIDIEYYYKYRRKQYTKNNICQINSEI